MADTTTRGASAIARIRCVPGRNASQPNREHMRSPASRRGGQAAVAMPTIRQHWEQVKAATANAITKEGREELVPPFAQDRRPCHRRKKAVAYLRPDPKADYDLWRLRQKAFCDCERKPRRKALCRS